jgi:3-methylcrotonyl-CoA carboxylase alpha subunit
MAENDRGPTPPSAIRHPPSGSMIEVLDVLPEEIHLRVDGRIHVVPFLVQGTTVSFVFDGETYVIDVDEGATRRRARHRDHSTSAPMPGVVLKILVKVGDVVTKGAPLVILEAMKMEHQITAGTDGTISAINCSEGELVQPGFDLVTVFESSSRQVDEKLLDDSTT